MKKQKQNESECKVKCTIKTKGHTKIYYPFYGNIDDCKLFIYTNAIIAMTSKHRERNLRYFYGFSRFDNSRFIFLSIKRADLNKLRIELTYEIEIND